MGNNRARNFAARILAAIGSLDAGGRLVPFRLQGGHETDV